MTKFYKTCFIWAGLIATCLVSINSAQGPAYLYSTGATGAPFDGGNHCSNLCHNSGNLYATTVSLILLDGGTPVTQYIPGNSYILRLTIDGNSLPIDVHYGFQVAASQNDAPAYTDVNSWASSATLGILGMHNQPLNGRSYVEHSAPFETNIIDIPWNGPTAGTGTVTFYAAGNIVDFTGGSGGDQANANSLTVTESALALKWINFSATKLLQGNLLQWQIADEERLQEFVIERGVPATGQFSIIGKITPSYDAGQAGYTFLDAQPSTDNYYRIRAVTLNNEVFYSRTLHVKSDSHTPDNYNYTKDAEMVLVIHADHSETGIITLYDLSGKKVQQQQVNLETGRNDLKVNKPAIPGMYFIQSVADGKTVYSGKIIVQ